MPPVRRLQLLSLIVLVALGAFVANDLTSRDESAAAPPAEVPALGPITIAAVGDTLLVEPQGGWNTLARDPGAAQIRDLISGATLAIANLEMNLLDAEEALTASARPEPRWPFGSPRDARQLRAWGFDLVSLANNHATDYGVEGFLATRRVLTDAGLLHAGAGSDLVDARRPVFPAGQRRVALLAVTTSSAAAARATEATPVVRGRPGVSPLRYEVDITVDPQTFEPLKQSVAGLSAGPPPGERELTLFGTPIRRGERTIVEFRVDARDEREILEHVRAARAAAEVVILSVHSHEPVNRSEQPADFVRHFARRAIDAGASLIVGHGPHRVRGVELYGDGAILYSLGNFVYPLQHLGAADEFDRGLDLFGLALGSVPARGESVSPPDEDPAWREGLVALATFDGGGGRLTRLRLHPLAIAGSSSRSAGWPRPADAQGGASILTRLRRLSTGWGVEFWPENGAVDAVRVRDP